ncbi:hypothetical protein QTQ03_22015 [Micromonospora sp. WMMA1363]|uniref:hypothetical protein n=1 Tax=Micromonospora sp. WMMA1363 TaxID=3053985 RepID=UPI00259D288C|nr:hypothetical protein [Micromonospora sp. WMMA1363]MDM4722135.1 hypothetical protein [Micromonospora sp. WMMA1363]
MKLLTTRTLRAVLIAATAAGTVLAAQPAIAGPAPADAYADVIRAATADKPAPITGGVSPESAFTGSVQGKKITVGAEAGSPVVVNSAGGDLKLYLPETGTGKAEQTRDGTVVRPGTDTSTAVQVLADGAVRAMVVLDNADAPTSYPFRFDLPEGLVLRASATDGSIDMVTTDGAMVAGKINAPWAQDAAGRSLHTWYELNGSTVTQHIDTTGATFPVVADPDYVHNCGLTSCNWTFTRWYTANVMHPAITGGGSIASILTGAIMCGKLPGAAGVACGAWVAVNYMQAYWHVINAKAKNHCFVARFQYVGVVSPINAFNTGTTNGEHCINR